MACWSLLFAFAYGMQCLTTTSERFRTDCPTMVEMLEQNGLNTPAAKSWNMSAPMFGLPICLRCIQNTTLNL